MFELRLSPPKYLSLERMTNECMCYFKMQF
jgi:hypothetical protein